MEYTVRTISLCHDMAAHDTLLFTKMEEVLREKEFTYQFMQYQGSAQWRKEREEV